MGGDGMTPLVDDTNTSYIYTSYQSGTISLFKNNTWVTSIEVPQGRWHTPMIFDPLNNKVVYYGGKYLYKTTRSGDTLSALTKTSSKKFGTIDAIEISMSGQGKTIYVANNTYEPFDFIVGGIWVSKDRGVTWTKTTFEKSYSVNHITADPKNDAIAYVASFGLNGESIYRTEDYGQTWTNISSNLPHIMAYDVLVDPDYSSTLYCSTKFGVYISLNTGKTWEALGSDLPEIMVKDLKIIKEGSEIVLYAGTYGRGIYSVRLTDAQRGGNGVILTKPTAPTNLHSSNVDKTTATLTWTDNSNNETGFKVYQDTNTTAVATLEANVTSYTPTELTADTNYTYSVKAYNDAGESNATTTTIKTLSAIFKKAHLTSPTANSMLSSNTMTVKWNRNSAHRVDLYVYNVTHNKHLFYKTVTGESKSVTVPTHGEKIVILMFSYDASGHFKGVEYFYVTAQGTLTTKYITSPINNSTLTSDTMTVDWDKNNASKVYLYIGDQSNIKTLFSGFVTSTSKTFTVPTHGERIHIMLIPFNSLGMMDGREDIYVNAKK